MSKRVLFPLIVILLVLIADQVLKIYIKTNMAYGDERMLIGEWFRFNFIENNGFAFGTEIGGKYGKLILSLFRLVAVCLIGFYLYSVIKDKTSKIRLGYLMMVGLILAGALGNIIDSTFYGLIFSESGRHGSVATLFPEGAGYAPLFYGKVVDMFYFPLIQGYWPDWMPWIGGNYMEFFRPIFNIADSAITLGVIGILLFYRRELKTFR